MPLYKYNDIMLNDNIVNVRMIIPDDLGQYTTIYCDFTRASEYQGVYLHKAAPYRDYIRSPSLVFIYRICA